MKSIDSVWSHTLLSEPGGTFRVEVIDEEGVRVPIGRQLSARQAQVLIERVAAEAEQSGQPVKSVVRNPGFMSATILTIKRQHLQ